MILKTQSTTHAVQIEGARVSRMRRVGGGVGPSLPRPHETLCRCPRSPLSSFETPWLMRWRPEIVTMTMRLVRVNVIEHDHEFLTSHLRGR